MAYILPPGVSFCGEYNPTPEQKTNTTMSTFDFKNPPQYHTTELEHKNAMWKEFEVELVNSHLNDLGVDTNETSLIMINTDEINYYFKNCDKNDAETVTVFFKGGGNADIRIKYEDFKKIMQHP